MANNIDLSHHTMPAYVDTLHHWLYKAPRRLLNPSPGSIFDDLTRVIDPLSVSGPVSIYETSTRIVGDISVAGGTSQG